MIRKKLDFGRIIIGIVLIGFAFLCLIPFYYILMVSFSDPALVKEGEVILFPKGFSTKAYEMIIRDQKFFRGFGVSVFRTVVGTALAMIVHCMFAYAVSRKHLAGRKWFMKLVIFAVLFNGGIIPTYLTICYTGIFDTIWALILPMAVNPWNTIILISFFSALPEGLEESAVIDGASDVKIFFKIAMPLSKPAIATIGLFTAVSHWNALMDAVIYINDSKLKPLQSYLIDLVMRSSTQEMFGSMAEQEIPTLSIQTAAIFASTLPILVVYPFVQKFFVKGVMIGAIKG